jgi:glyoxylase-like metal-dependent hydrolase (beta-lactamase superfamily II)
MKLIKRTDRLYEVPMGFVKAYIIQAGDNLVLIDTGIEGKADAILEAIDRAGLDSSKLKHILITQLHRDHVGSLHALKEKTGSRVYAHELEADAIEQGITMRFCVPTPSLLSRIAVPRILKGDWKKRIEGTKVEVRLKDGDVLSLGVDITVLHSPGHTAGHVCYLFQDEQKVLIAGDVATGGKRPGYPMLFEDEEQGYRTLKDLGNRDFDMVFFGHGKAITREASKMFNKRF